MRIGFRKSVAALAVGVILGASSASAEGTPATLAVDMDKSSILVAGFADAPQPADLMARILTMAIVLTDTEAALASKEDQIKLGSLTMTIDEALGRIARDGDPAAMTLLAAHFSLTPEVFSARLNEMAVRTGGLATDIDVTVVEGTPRFSGVTTLRDTARAILALSQTFGPEMEGYFSGTSAIQSGFMSAESAGVCAITAKVVESQILILSAGKDRKDCVDRAQKTGTQTFRRVLAEHTQSSL